ncbi:MAG TPA: radical SAM protein [Candidatus Sulfomarinibacteraceae bacterium]|nr:radical SAM protein [Candidatus Sulfomarinibacteraceae bacterium]
MIVEITPDTHEQIRNPAFAAYAGLYLDIYRNFMAQVRATGIEIVEEDNTRRTQRRLQELQEKGAKLRNSDRSVFLNRISPACVACQKGVGSATYFISLQCHRDCYYCFNPNQVDYDYYSDHQRDLSEELAQARSAGHRIHHLALTGGEPLVHKEETYEFFRSARQYYPRAHSRLYTTGDQANDDVLQSLQESGLQEIRFSIRMHDMARGQRHTLERIARATEYIPTVMVEMPVLPGTRQEMEALLLELDALQIHSINLLEFCYPLTNADEFRQRDFKVKRRPYKTLYNYWYAGGVPIDGSEALCLDLVEFALERELTMGVHYCSLENKLTGQNYQQNAGKALPRTAYFSENDYLLKSAKVFGTDIPKVYNAFRKNGYRNFQKNDEPRFLEFHVSQIETLRDLDIEIGLSTSTLEQRQGDEYVRELKVDLTTPQTFDMARDV